MDWYPSLATFADIAVASPQRMDRYRYADFDILDEQTVHALLDPRLEPTNVCRLVTNEGAISNTPDGYHQEFLYAHLKKNLQSWSRPSLSSLR